MTTEYWQTESTLDSLRSYVLFSVAAVIATALVSVVADDSPFDRFLAGVPAPIAMAVMATVGAFSLMLLSARGWSVGSAPGWTPLVVALGFSVVAIAVDTVVPFPEDTNVGWPTSVLFYPAIGFLAEILFHVTPVAIIVGLTGWRFGSAVDDWRVWLIIGTVAVAEAAFQVAAAATDGTDSRLVVFVALHLLAIGLAELTMFRRFGFGALMTFRMAYYLLWHVGWGHIRLSLLF
ncbi:MAG: hypothetical protein OER95_11750 [Acidimicrobiia bacterium]|nr:hypothetical protein [Acidimicrobiia bacterium]